MRLASYGSKKRSAIATRRAAIQADKANRAQLYKQRRSNSGKEELFEMQSVKVAYNKKNGDGEPSQAHPLSEVA